MKILKPVTRRGKLVLIIIMSLITVHIVQVVQASTAEPGTDQDPLVSQSYVDQKISELTDKIVELEKGNNDTDTEEFTTKIKELSDNLDKLTAENEDYKTKLTDIEKYGKFVPLELKEKQTLTLGDSAEIILRSGKAKAIAGEGGGLSDITAGTGTDIKTDQDVPLNHLLLISRDDGRGIKATSKKVWVLVKGPYTIE